MRKRFGHIGWTRLIMLKSSANEGFDECYLLDDLDGAMEEWDRAEDVGMPFYRSSRFTKSIHWFLQEGLHISLVTIQVVVKHHSL